MNSKIKSLLITVVLATAILCSGGFVSAQTTDNSALIAQLQTLIQSLMQQIQQIIAQQQNGQIWCHTFNSNIKIGDSAGEVQYLGTALQKQGFTPGAAVSEGAGYYFDETTAAAVVKFQAKYGIIQTGYVGPLTRAKLNSLYGCGITPPTCTPNWTCSWGACTNGYQTATYKDSNNCGLPTSVVNMCGAPIQCQTTQPSITVTSPNGGTYKQGDTINIQWQLTGTPWASDKIYVTIQNFGGSTGDGSIPAITATSGTGTYNYTVPSTLLPSAMYKVAVSGVVNGVAVSGNTSNYFSIISLSPSISPITVTFPNGGEQWLQGSTQTITWAGGNYSSGGYPGFDITLYPQPNSTCDITCVRSGAQRVAANFVTATGAYSWQVSNNITPGNYLVEICAGGSGNLSAETACDDAGGINNNQYITVVALATPTVTFTASNSNGQTFDTNNITVQVGSDTNFVYSSTNATNCYAYVNSALMNSTDIGLTQGSTSGHFEQLARFPGSSTFTITCSNASGQQASKSITLNSTN